mmetsp:Transcript_14930/g.30678  ORF Transcript_14930/g.30678 Transcript_14930/m.30678 type:complete len:293 (+) Transcript_14930:275-1153(+)
MRSRSNSSGGSGGGSVFLPRAGELSLSDSSRLRAVGRSMVKCFFEGRRVGSRFAPSFFKYLAHGDTFKHVKHLEPRILADLKKYDPEMGSSLEWVLSHDGICEELGLDFEELPGLDACPVTDANKADFVKRKVRWLLLESRKQALEAVRTGFWQALVDLSPEAEPFLRLLSATDWSLLLCGEDSLSSNAVVSCLRFNGFSSNAACPRWLSQTLAQLSPDNLRRFLIFCTGSPSLPPDTEGFEITVQRVPQSEALPVAHTCFSKLDLPDYKDQALFEGKLMKAIQECATFDRV